MSTYSDNLGFVPSTYDNILQRYYELLVQYTGYHQTFDEFLQSDLYLVFQGVARLKFDDDILFAQIIENFFKWLKESQIKIEQGYSNTYSGFYHALKKISQDVRFITTENDPQIQAGEMVIVLEDPDMTQIDEVFKNNQGVSVITKPNKTKYMPNKTRNFILDNGQSVNYHFLDSVVNENFFVKIRYRRLEGEIIPSREMNLIKETFTNHFNQVMRIGTAFEPERYLSTQNIPFVADFEVTYNLTGKTAPYMKGVYHTPLHQRLKMKIENIDVLDDL